MAVILYLLVLVLLEDVSCKVSPQRNARTFKYVRYKALSQDIIIPIMIHLDTAVAHQMSKAEGYKITEEGTKRLNFKPQPILREVEKLYNAKSLFQKVQLKLVNVKIVNNKTFDVDENVSNYLRSYCEWQNGMKIQRGDTYFSVLITGLDVYYIANNGRKVRESTGRGYMGKMCTTHKSCAIVKWNPKELVYLLAHEIAHSIGVYHDGTNNSCGNGFIMSAQYSRERIPQYWSTCSKTHLQEFLRNKEKSWCLSNKYKRSTRRY